MDLAHILRSQNIKRWTITNTAKQQSLAEHTFNVVAISRRLCQDFGLSSDVNVMKLAFDHDLDEVFTGDIPTPAKKMINFETPYNGSSKDKCLDLERRIVKAADILEALLFIGENGVGKHAKSCEDYLMTKFMDYIKECDAHHHGFFATLHNLWLELISVDFTGE